jgi:hypothetical protein
MIFNGSEFHVIRLKCDMSGAIKNAENKGYKIFVLKAY